MNQSQIGSEVPPKPAQYLERHFIIISKGGKNKIKEVPLKLVINITKEMKKENKKETDEDIPLKDE